MMIMHSVERLSAFYIVEICIMKNKGIERDLANR